MANILTIDNLGNINFLQNGQTTPTPGSTTPLGSISTGSRPCSRVYQSRRYIVGAYAPGIVYDEYGNFTAIGIGAPQQAPTLTAIAPLSGGSGVTGNMIGYVTFAYKIGPVVIAESNPSPSTGIVVFSNQARQWTNLPSLATNPKVNTIRGYVSVGGAVPLLAWERPIGCLSASEQVATGSLGISLPVDDSGNLTFANGVPPAGATMIENYHDRMWYNDPSNPSYVFYSEVGEPEAVGALNFLQTRDREPITAVNRVDDVLIVQGQSVTYDIQGYSTVDFNVRKITANIGCVNNFTAININEVLWFLSQDGVYTYNGATFRYMMKKVATYFRTDYLANRSLYENSFAADDRYDHLYKLLLPVAGSETRPNYWCCPYADIDPAMAGLYGSSPGSQGFGNEPVWHFDNRARADYTMLQALAPGTNRGDFFVASTTDGYIRKENVETDTSDDSDSNNKTFSLTHGHNLLGQPSGDVVHGKFLTEIDIFGTFEQAGGTVYIWMGDESAGTAPIDQAVALAIGATAITNTVAMEDIYQRLREAGLQGRGYTIKISVPSAIGNEYRGHAMEWEPGVQSRMPNT